jgi:hypothetical protein
MEAGDETSLGSVRTRAVCFHHPVTFDPHPVRDLSGAEVFEGLDASVLDFWKFAMSDLRTK